MTASIGRRIPELARGASVGRYVILSMIGRGGMGEVYAAYDPELDRKIALKLLRFDPGTGINKTEGRGRLLREAQAIARLSDPNVVVVFDVGTYSGRVFLAMEFVDGNTLGYWLQAEPRTYRQVLAIFLAAGRGLSAAHRAGLVHRDFKPENAMVGRDGGVRVMDFGLARVADLDSDGDGIGGEGGGRRTSKSIAIAVPGFPGPRSSPPEPQEVADVIDIGSGRLRQTDDLAIAVPGPTGAGASGLDPHDGVVRDGAREPYSAALGPRRPTGSLPVREDVVATRDLSTAVGVAPRSTANNALASPLTETGAMMGTPAYMAPEQFAGKPADARSDQFSFCVSLYEGLYGKRPFAGKTIQELTRNVTEGRVLPAPPQSRIPSWLRRIVLRGLSVDPAARYPSMDALLAALSRDPTRTRRRIAASVVGAAVLVAAAAGVLRYSQRGRLMCAHAADPMNAVWEPSAAGVTPHKKAVRDAFLATGKRYAADAFATVMGAFDRYAEGWIQMRQDACEATNVRGEQSAEVLDLRMACLQDRLGDMRALASVFTKADGDVVSKSVQAAQSLRPIEVCADVPTLKAVVKPPEDSAVRRAVADVRTRLSDVKALIAAGRYKAAEAELPSILVAARATKYEPGMAEASLTEAKLFVTLMDGPRAEKAYEDALWSAERSRHDEVVAEASTQLVFAVGTLQNRLQEGQRWADFSSAVLGRLGPGHDVLASWRANNLVGLRLAENRPEAAAEAAREAIRLKTRALGAGAVDVAISRDGLAVSLGELGATSEALEEEQRAIAIAGRALGANHPFVGNFLANLAGYYNAGGRFSDARSAASSAYAILHQGESADSLPAGLSLKELGVAELGLNEPAKAVADLEAALWCWEGKSVPIVELSRTRLSLIRALAGVGGDRRRAISLAKSVVADLGGTAEGGELLAEAKQWLSNSQLAALAAR